MMVPRLAICLALFALGGCTMTGSHRLGSYVSAAISPVDISELSADAAGHLRRTFAAAKTTIALYPARIDSMTETLAEDLRTAGFGVAIYDSRHRTTNAAVPVHFYVSELDGGVLVRLQYQNKLAARWFERAANGALVAAAPYTVREAGE